MLPVIFNLDSDPSLFSSLASALPAEMGELEQRRFPDNENYLRVNSDCQGKDIFIFCNLFRPDDKILRLIFLTDTLKEMGANKLVLITPYLPYMRQDKQFLSGECVSSKPFSKLLSSCLDGLITMDPHLHRYHALDDIYTLHSKVVSAAPLIAHWIEQHIPNPILIGPDIESEQWVSQVATLAKAPYEILNKIRHGDKDVEISTPSNSDLQHKTPVLVDDIISSGRTMIETVKRLQEQGMKKPTCIGVHGIFSGEAYQALAAIADIVTTECIPHPSNRIDIAQPIADAANELLNELT